MIDDPAFHADVPRCQRLPGNPGTPGPGADAPRGSTSQRGPTVAERSTVDVTDPRARLEFLESVIADHDDCDESGYCLGCRRDGLWADYPCDTRVGAERSVERTQDLLARQDRATAAGGRGGDGAAGSGGAPP